MTRQECEQRLIQLLEQANAVYQEFNPAGSHLDMYCINGQISVSDALKDEDGNLIKDSSGNYVRSIDCTKFENGEIWNTDKWESVRRVQDIAFKR